MVPNRESIFYFFIKEQQIKEGNRSRSPDRDRDRWIHLCVRDKFRTSSVDLHEAYKIGEVLYDIPRHIPIGLANDGCWPSPTSVFSRLTVLHDAADQFSSTSFISLFSCGSPSLTPVAHILTVRSQIMPLPIGCFRSSCFLFYVARLWSLLSHFFCSLLSHFFCSCRFLIVSVQFVRRGNSSSYSVSFFLVCIQLMSTVFMSCIVLCFLFSFW